MRGELGFEGLGWWLFGVSGYDGELPQSFVLGVSAVSAVRCIGDRD